MFDVIDDLVESTLDAPSDDDVEAILKGVVCSTCGAQANPGISTAAAIRLWGGLCLSCYTAARDESTSLRAQRRAAKKLEDARRKRASAREARKDLIAAHGEYAGVSDRRLELAFESKRSKLCRTLRSIVWQKRVVSRATLREEALLRKQIDEAWYACNPYRVCKVCGVRKRLYDFVRKTSSGRFGGFTCRPCSNKRDHLREKERKALLPKVEKPPVVRVRVIVDPEVIATRRREYRKKAKERNRKDPVKRINRNFSSVIRNHANKFKQGKPSGGWKAMVGYQLEDLKAHLEAQFRDGMSWENYGEWHIDHIKPKAAFNIQKFCDEEFKACWALDNLQPLWAEENVAKGATYEGWQY